MAKQNYLKLAVVIVLTMAATSSFATVTLLTGTTSVGGSSFAASNKVSCGYEGGTTAGAAATYSTSVFNATTYGIGCAHASGDKVIAAIGGDAKLYFAVSTGAGAAVSGATGIPYNQTFTATATWTSM